MIGFFRMVFYAVVAYFIYKFVMLVLGPRAGSPRRPGARGGSGVMVKDEVCNTYLPREDALKITVDGAERYFCSEACRARFLAAAKKDRKESPGRTFS